MGAVVVLYSTNDRKLLQIILSGDEPMVLCYNPQSQTKSMAWRKSGEVARTQTKV